MDAVARMQMFQKLFYVSLTLAGIGLGLAIFFFFYFNIREIYMIRSGKDRKNAVEDMTQRSARNGRLRRMNKQPQKQSGKPVDSVPAAAAPVAPAAAMDTMPLNQANSTYTEPVSEETTYLNEQAATASFKEHTELLFGEETTELRSNQRAENAAAACGFVLTENTILIHTDEII